MKLWNGDVGGTTALTIAAIIVWVLVVLAVAGSPRLRRKFGTQAAPRLMPEPFHLGGLQKPDAAVSPDNPENIRVISIYATAWRYRSDDRQDYTDASRRLEDRLPLGEALEEFHHLFKDQLPGLLDYRLLKGEALGLPPIDADAPGESDALPPRIVEVRTWLFRLASDQVVLALDIEAANPRLNVDATPTIHLLERSAFARFTIADLPIGEYTAQVAAACGCTLLNDDGSQKPELYRTQLAPERHQVVFAPPARGRFGVFGRSRMPDWALRPILYRKNPPFRPEFIRIKRPEGLNEGSLRQGVVTPYTSLLIGHHQSIENSVFLTAVQAVGTSARFRQIWHRAHELIRIFRENMQREENGIQNRDEMEGLADELGNLELELSFAVETASDLGLLIPTLRSASFHRDLHSVIELQERAERVSRLFTQLDASIRSELTAIGIREAGLTDQHRAKWNLAINLVGFIVVPIGFVLSVFGINTKEITATSDSMWDFGKFWPVYAIAVLLAFTPLIVRGLMRLFEGLVEHRTASPVARPAR
jgi:hypothetical protein